MERLLKKINYIKRICTKKANIIIIAEYNINFSLFSLNFVNYKKEKEQTCVFLQQKRFKIELFLNGFKTDLL
jgi:hypothetical protein